MAQGLLAGATAGQIFRHERFYQDASGKWQTKYLLVLAATSGGDLIFRLLTSRAHGRAQAPPCHHGDPSPAFYLGILGNPLTKETWLDLRGQDDYEGSAFEADNAKGILKLVLTLPLATLCQALDCASGADDTTRQQERLMRDQRAALGCP
jgi:hypothetical protein